MHDLLGLCLQASVHGSLAYHTITLHRSSWVANKIGVKDRSVWPFHPFSLESELKSNNQKRHLVDVDVTFFCLSYANLCPAVSFVRYVVCLLVRSFLCYENIILELVMV